MTLTIICTPGLRSSTGKAAEHLEKASPDKLLLPFPEAFNHLLLKLFDEKVSIDEILEEASRKGYLPEPIGYFKYLYEPLVKAISTLKMHFPGLKVACYKDPEGVSRMNDLAAYKASLTLYTAISGKVRVQEWRSLLEEELKSDKESIDNAADNIVREYEPFLRVICMAHLEGRHLYERLKRGIRRIALRYIGTPYFFTPLEALKRLISIRGLSGVSDETIEEHVKLHVDYVRNYVIPSKEYDAGYLKWLIKNFKK
ncbi:MAG: hypothetical protein QW638_08465 [Candidatus Bathyarchaeia archaeon]|nr:hypothetical protein [Candidatus Bathyarchaeota archaeon]